MISFKAGIRLTGLQTETLAGLAVVASILTERGYGTTVTSGSEGVHMEDSLHYKGLALDIRSKHLLSMNEKEEVLVECQGALGENYDFILENVGQPTEHFHLEFQPKE